MHQRGIENKTITALISEQNQNIILHMPLLTPVIIPPPLPTCMSVLTKRMNMPKPDAVIIDVYSYVATGVGAAGSSTFASSTLAGSSTLGASTGAEGSGDLLDMMKA